MLFLKRLMLVIFFVLAGVAVFLLCLRNEALVDVDFLFGKLSQVPIEQVIFASFLLGVLSGILASLGIMFRMYRKHRRILLPLKQQLKDINKAVVVPAVDSPPVS